MKTRYLVAAAVAALSIGSVANATMFIRATDNGTVFIDSIGSDSLNGVTSGNGVFTVSASSVGTPGLPDPGFSTQLLTMSAAANLSIAHTLVVELTQTPLTSTGTAFAVTNTINTGAASAVSGGNASAFLGNGTAYSALTLLASLNCSASTSCSTGAPVITTAAHGATYDETVRYTFTFAAGSAAQSVQASTQISAATVPEPATWGMMVLGFGVIGGALRTSRRKVMFA